MPLPNLFFYVINTLGTCRTRFRVAHEQVCKNPDDHIKLRLKLAGGDKSNYIW